MSGPLFFIDRVPDEGKLAVLDGDEGFHAATVRRIRVGENSFSATAQVRLPHCVVEETAKEPVGPRPDRRTAAPPRPPVTVVQAIPKAERSELAIELATEAGADGFLAWQASRCVARWDGPKADKGLRRWRAVARSAARQSRRAFIPDVDGVVSTGALVQRIREAVADGAWCCTSRPPSFTDTGGAG